LQRWQRRLGARGPKQVAELCHAIARGSFCCDWRACAAAQRDKNY
jgi:predicted secreted Zn-dependent protease